jgi:hypothetical protein
MAASKSAVDVALSLLTSPRRWSHIWVSLLTSRLSDMRLLHHLPILGL